MRGQDRSRLRSRRSTLAAAAFGAFLVLAVGALSAQVPDMVPRVTGGAQPMESLPAQPLARPITDDVRKMRSYPEQPPVIPHSIDGYQLTLNANRCLDCHRRQYTEGSRAPMISITHFMDRDGQMLADVTPRRYFCTACHVQQTDAKPLVGSTFEDMLMVGKQKP